MRLLIVGLGSTGQRHLRNLLAMGYDDIILCRTGRATLRCELLERFPVAHSIEKALTYDPIAAFVCTPTSAHLDAAGPFVRSGCHLFIEKPVSDRLTGCDEILNEAKEKRLTTMVGFQFRFHPVLIAIQNLLVSGDLGRIVSVHAHWGEYLPDWHPWEDYRDSYAAKKDLGGGAALTLCHPVDYLRWMIGEISEMTAMVSQMHVLSTDVDEAVQFSVRFQNGVIGSIYVDFVRRPPSHTLTIIAEGGTVVWDNTSGSAVIMPAGTKEYCIEPPCGFERNSLFCLEIKHFIDCVQAAQQTRVPLEEGVRALELILKAVREEHGA